MSALKSVVPWPAILTQMRQNNLMENDLAVDGIYRCCYRTFHAQILVLMTHSHSDSYLR